MSAIDVRQLVKKFNGQTVLHGIDLDVAPGEIVAIIGPSGSGKTTLLRSINLLEVPDAGRIKVGDITIDASQGIHKQKEQVRLLRQQVGFVFQNFNLFPHLTVLENLIEAPIAHRQLSKREAITRAGELLDIVGLRHKADAWPRHLSGGQQQRIAIARALMLQPRVMLFDEPTSALDPELVGEVLDVIKKLARSGTTLVIVTHEVGFAREVADNVVFMVDGKIVEQGSSTQVLNHPRHERTRRFLARVL
jgi:polar amino acid transport system ATP-binding protein